MAQSLKIHRGIQALNRKYLTLENTLVTPLSPFYFTHSKAFKFGPESVQLFLINTMSIKHL